MDFDKSITQSAQEIAYQIISTQGFLPLQQVPGLNRALSKLPYVSGRREQFCRQVPTIRMTVDVQLVGDDEDPGGEVYVKLIPVADP